MASGAATTIFAVVDRKPEIDSSRDDGKPVPKEISQISLENVRFSYPSRKSVEVVYIFFCLRTSVNTVIRSGIKGSFTDDKERRDGGIGRSIGLWKIHRTAVTSTILRPEFWRGPC